MDAVESLRAMFPRASTITISLHSGRSRLLVQHDTDDDVTDAANALGARVGAVFYQGVRWIAATGAMFGVEVEIIGPHHKLAEANPDGPNIDFILPAWRPTDPAVSP